MTLKPSQPARGTLRGKATRSKAQALAAAAAAATAQHQPPTPYDWAADPIWTEPIPEPPDWDTLDDHQRSVYKLAVLAYAIRAVADTRGVAAADLLSAWHGKEAQ